MDLFVVPTLGFNLLYVFVIVRLARRELIGSMTVATRQRKGLRSKISSKHFQREK
jgi:hypothetical protein